MDVDTLFMAMQNIPRVYFFDSYWYDQTKKHSVRLSLYTRNPGDSLHTKTFVGEHDTSMVAAINQAFAEAATWCRANGIVLEVGGHGDQ